MRIFITLILFFSIVRISFADNSVPSLCTDNENIITRKEIMLLTDKVEATKESKKLKSKISETKDADGRTWYRIKYEVEVNVSDNFLSPKGCN